MVIFPPLEWSVDGKDASIPSPPLPLVPKPAPPMALTVPFTMAISPQPTRMPLPPIPVVLVPPVALTVTPPSMVSFAPDAETKGMALITLMPSLPYKAAESPPVAYSVPVPVMSRCWSCSEAIPGPESLPLILHIPDTSIVIVSASVSVFLSNSPVFSLHSELPAGAVMSRLCRFSVISLDTTTYVLIQD